MNSAIVTPFPLKRKEDKDLPEVEALYKAAEDKIKAAERQCAKLAIPGINELRYAGRHILNALLAQDAIEKHEQLQRAKNHCKRAIYDAVEIRLLDYLQTIKSYEHDYRSISIAKVMPEYLSMRQYVREIKGKLDEAQHNHREDYLDECEKYVPKLKEFADKFEDAQPELQKAVSYTRWKVIAAIATLIVATIAAIGKLFLL